MWTLHYGSPVPQQNNGFDCGVYCCAFVELLLQNLPLAVTPTDITVYHHRITLALIHGSASML